MNLHLSPATCFFAVAHSFFLFSAAALSTFHVLYPDQSTFVSIYKNDQPML